MIHSPNGCLPKMNKRLLPPIGLFIVLSTCAPLGATVTILSMTPSSASPQPLGTRITWTVTATDSNPNPLTFQFNVASGSQSFNLAKDFNIGTSSAGVWTAQPFVWTTIAGEGTYTIQVIAKDFVSGETAAQTAAFNLTALAGKEVTVHKTANPLVALFSAPSCAAANSMRVAFYTGSNPPVYTNWAACQPPTSMNFYIAGMLPSTTYSMYWQVGSGGVVEKSGVPVTFTTGSLPAKLPAPNVFPSLTVNIPAGPQTDTTNALILWGFLNTVVPIATDLAGDIEWYYSGNGTVVTRPLSNGTLLTFQNGTSFSSSNAEYQLMRQIDFAGNILRETNTGVLAQQLLAMGATDGGPCPAVSSLPAPVGTACLNDLSHDAIQFSIDGQQYTALLAHVEKIFPAGTQGTNPSGPPVDILSEMLLVLNSQWQVVWYYDSFQQLNIQRAAVLGEVCTSETCPVRLVLAASAHDWTHGNCVYYIASSGDFLVSLRNQDWLIKVNYNNGAGAGNVLWTMGWEDSNFTFNNIGNDPWPWFSHQHDATYQNNGAGPLTLFDNGNTRVSSPPLGLGSNCGPSDCYSRGMALTVVEPTATEPVGTVTPVISVDLGVYANADGSAGLLSSGNYFFMAGVPVYGIQILPTPETLTGTQVLNISSPQNGYRSWQMPNLYNPPAY
jgi:arylsulfate sulfotransferase